MASIFDLKTSTSELSSANMGTSRLAYDQQGPTRDVSGDAFTNGKMHFKYQVGGQTWWMPSRCYMRARCRLRKKNGDQLDLSDQIAPNFGMMSNLFQSADFKINNKTISRIAEFMPQVDALDTRRSKSRSWMKSIGAGTNWWEPNTSSRIAAVSSDGVELGNTPYSQAAPVGRLALGFHPTNTWEYDAGLNRLTFAGGGGALPADVRVVFPIGSFIEILSGGLDNGEGQICRVVGHNSVTAITIEGNIGDGVNAAASDFQRVENPELVGEATRRLDGFEVIWQPPLSIFKIEHAIPGGDFELTLNPQTRAAFQKAAIESFIDKNSAVDFEFIVDDFYLYVATVDGPRADNVSYLLDLEETRCHMDEVQSGGTFQQRKFNVSPSSYALTCAFQDSRAGSQTQFSPSKFQLNSPGGVIGGDELKLNRMFIKYAGQSKPDPDANPLYKVGNAADYSVQRWAESQLHTGAYWDMGGSETIQEFHNSGAYYHFQWPRDGTDRNTEVTVNYGFAGGAISNARVLLFDHYKAVARVTVTDGRVTGVQLEDE